MKYFLWLLLIILSCWLFSSAISDTWSEFFRYGILCSSIAFIVFGVGGIMLTYLNGPQKNN